jgi:prolipoprotein diacylglyceryltransferase
MKLFDENLDKYESYDFTEMVKEFWIYIVLGAIIGASIGYMLPVTF